MKFRAIITWKPKLDLTVTEPVYFTFIELSAMPAECRFSMRELVIPWLSKGNLPDRYTGGQDKNAIDIYEEDAVKDNKGKTWIVKWSDEFSRFYLKGKGHEHSLFMSDQFLEIIGDTHRNPDFVENKIININFAQKI